jgi:predicted nuclease of restriction endonuclease-like RecB superfamily
MLTGKLAVVRTSRDRIFPQYVDVADPALRALADRLLDVVRRGQGRARGELAEELDEHAKNAGMNPLVTQGLAKLIDDRCTYEVVSTHPPAELRDEVFRAAALARKAAGEARTGAFDRSAVLAEVAAARGMAPAELEAGLFADLAAAQRLITFADLSTERLLQRYNTSLAQAVLLRAVHLVVAIRGESPRRLRHILRRAKFHRLVCEPRATPDGVELHLDGPLSLFTATQKYGVQLAMFLPSILGCRDFDLQARVLWGPRKRPLRFQLTAHEGLVADSHEQGMYVPPELGLFQEQFRKQVAEWELREAPEVVALGEYCWVPDFQLIHRASGCVIHLDILGYWRRSGVEQLLDRLRRHAKTPFLLAIADRLRLDDEALTDLPAEVHRFRNMPQARAIAAQAERILAAGQGGMGTARDES